MNLFTHRDLWAWLNNPLGVPPDPGMPQQLAMRFQLGQHTGGLDSLGVKTRPITREKH
jgi:hypothetical protein